MKEGKETVESICQLYSGNCTDRVVYVQVVFQRLCGVDGPQIQIPEDCECVLQYHTSMNVKLVYVGVLEQCRVPKDSTREYTNIVTLYRVSIT